MGRDKGLDSELRKRDGAKRGDNYVDSAEYHFADHAYRFERTDGTLTYYSESYSLNNNDFGDLAYLASNGWNVIVSDGPTGTVIRPSWWKFGRLRLKDSSCGGRTPSGSSPPRLPLQSYDKTEGAGFLARQPVLPCCGVEGPPVPERVSQLGV